MVATGSHRSRVRVGSVCVVQDLLGRVESAVSVDGGVGVDLEVRQLRRVAAPEQDADGLVDHGQRQHAFVRAAGRGQAQVFVEDEVGQLVVGQPGEVCGQVDE